MFIDDLSKERVNRNNFFCFYEIGKVNINMYFIEKFINW